MNSGKERAGRAQLCGTPRRRLRAFEQAVTIDDLRAVAHRNLPRFALEYLEGGAETETALAENVSSYHRHRFRPKMLVDMRAVELSQPIFGRKASLPLAIAPTGLNALYWPDADLALARAAAQAGIPFSQSTVSSNTIADCAAVPNGRHWFQLYTFGEDSVWQGLIAQAEAAGSEVLIVTVDAQALGNREWDRRNMLAPLSLRPGAKLDAALHPRWLLRGILRHGYPRLINVEPFLPEAKPNVFDTARAMGQKMRLDLDWTLLARMRALWPRKLVVKGIMRLDDALKAQQIGCDGVVLSNHGGRQLDRTIAALDLVAPLRAAAGPDFTILIDGGIRRGADIAIARALGADAVMIGRATLYGVAAAGEAGAARAIAILIEEYRRTLVLLGIARSADLSPDILAESGPCG